MECIKITSLHLEDKRAKQKSAFARTSAFANYKLFAFANYGCSLLLAPRQEGFSGSSTRDLLSAVGMLPKK